MGMKRTTVFAHEADLAILKSAAIRRGVPEAELIRDAIHLAAMANRAWTESFFSQTYPPSQQSGRRPPVSDLAEEAWAEKADAYQRTKDPSR